MVVAPLVELASIVSKAQYQMTKITKFIQRTYIM